MVHQRRTDRRRDGRTDGGLGHAWNARCRRPLTSRSEKDDASESTQNQAGWDRSRAARGRRARTRRRRQQQRQASRRRPTGHLRRELGRGRHAGLLRGGALAGGGPRDLRVRGDRRLRPGDGDQGRPRAPRGRRRRSPELLGRGGGRRGGASCARELSPGADGIIDAAYTSSLAAFPTAPPKSNGVTVGAAVADLLITQRWTTASGRTPATRRRPAGPGVWIPTAATPPLGPYLGLMRPFSLPPRIGSGPAGRRPSGRRSRRTSTTRSRRSVRSRPPRHERRPDGGGSVLGGGSGSAGTWLLRNFVLDHQLDVATPPASWG